MPVTCLIVDDDPQILRYVQTNIEKEHFIAVTKPSGEDALSYLESKDVDIAIVDIMMHGMNGFELCQTLKNDYELPVIMLTARDALTDKERAFLAGTDDYVTKPFEVKELIFRIKAVLNRYNINHKQVLKVGDLVIDEPQLEIKAHGKTMILPNKEFMLINILSAHPNQVFSREDLIEKIWGFDYEGDERTVDVHIKRLRKRLSKLESNVSIKTVRGLGYKVVTSDV
ncbi:response regulator transcription factor [Staphylococcus massiliensis]|uniref:response regulator transcription factor n=1 Tax=Staphylococcus massiliensis TaxID=555791 RepID=UPI001EE03E7F|nr:response regulator transcription factor [Staphylococcus massiliensis]MCG3402400.1 response regulator transcription factor [Staphylococcus massiliensis]